MKVVKKIQPCTVTPNRGRRRFSGEMEKRTYANFTIRAVCPKCGLNCESDLAECYLSYPVDGVRHDMTMVCADVEGNECCEFTVRVIARVVVEAAS